MTNRVDKDGDEDGACDLGGILRRDVVLAADELVVLVLVHQPDDAEDDDGKDGDDRAKRRDRC